MMEQVKLPTLNPRDSQSSVASSDRDSNAMEVEGESLSQPFTQHFSQSQALTVQNDQEEVERIDFSMLGDASAVRYR